MPAPLHDASYFPARIRSQVGQEDLIAPGTHESSPDQQLWQGWPCLRWPWSSSICRGVGAPGESSAPCAVVAQRSSPTRRNEPLEVSGDTWDGVVASNDTSKLGVIRSSSSWFYLARSYTSSEETIYQVPVWIEPWQPPTRNGISQISRSPASLPSRLPASTFRSPVHPKVPRP